MNSRPLSPHQQQLLSEYADGNLSMRQKAEVEALLKDNPQAAATLQELRQVRTLLRSLPARRLPHNFTLTRSMAQAQKRPPLLPWLRFSSILAALLMVFVVFLDLQPRNIAPQTAEMYNSAEAAPTAPIIYWNGQSGNRAADAQVMGMGGNAEAGPTNKLPIQPTPPAQKFLPENNNNALPSDAQPILGLRPEEGGQILATQPGSQQQSVPPNLPLPQWVKIILAILTVLLGTLSIWLNNRWRRGN
jgi:hypothetical protein